MCITPKIQRWYAQKHWKSVQTFSSQPAVLTTLMRRCEMSHRKAKNKCKTHWITKKGFNTHHRKARSKGGSSNPSNLSYVPVREHHAYNILFGGNATAHEVARILSEVWVDATYEIFCVKRGEPCGRGCTYGKSYAAENA